MLTRLAPSLAMLLLAGPILLGLTGTLLPAFGYLPALGGMHPTGEYLARLLQEPAIFHSALMSFAAGLITAAVSLTVVMLFVGGWAGTRLFSRVLHLVSPLLSVPHAAAAFGLAFLVAPSGMIARFISPELTGWTRPPDVLILHDAMGLTMMAGLVIKEIPFLFLVTLAALPQIRLAETRALAASLGYGRVAGFLFGLWPQLYPQIRLAVFAVVAFSSSVVDVATILGPTSPAPLAVRLLGWMNDPDLSMRYLASAGAMLQLIVTAAALGAWTLVERICAALRDSFAAAGKRLRRDHAIRIAAFAAMTLSATVVIAGLGTLAVWSVAGLWQFPHALPKDFTLKSWIAAGPRILSPLTTTLVVAFFSTLLAVALTLLCLAREDEKGRKVRRGTMLLFYLPLLVPQAAFLFGLQLFFILTNSAASIVALVFAHFIFVMPYVFLSLSDPWRAFDRRYDAIAAGLGKGAWVRLLRVRLPMLTRAILTAAAVGFAVSIGQYLPTVLIGAGRLTTITSEAVALASGGNRRVIGVYAFLQMVLPALGFLVATLVPALLFRRFRAMRV
ncbi:putative thiamine transport system permease protein [Mesorhizobium sp. J18]|uniref:ABC transporter permease n=1 Tax=Mesorhizobium sp. J18 TaxID=935263 RepID=UPI001198FA08|nr:ABC transporter permease subunit [Mesorhizobium sp. J18]TWG91294.1 putative thiamine transport system permease protein [Mesorhizobium sp. J18]